eukprot:621031-Amphidinium_carterae.1
MTTPSRNRDSNNKKRPRIFKSSCLSLFLIKFLSVSMVIHRLISLSMQRDSDASYINPLNISCVQSIVLQWYSLNSGTLQSKRIGAMRCPSLKHWKAP